MTQKSMKMIRLPKLLTIGWSHILLECCSTAEEHDGPVEEAHREPRAEGGGVVGGAAEQRRHGGTEVHIGGPIVKGRIGDRLSRAWVRSSSRAPYGWPRRRRRSGRSSLTPTG